MQNDEMWLEGIISIEAALAAQSRDIFAVYYQQSGRKQNNRQWLRLHRMAQKMGIAVEPVDAAFIAERVSGQSHGGVIAGVGPRRFVSLEKLIEGEKRPFIVMLDGVEDPFNFGQSLRALYAAGVTGVVVRPRNWTFAAGVVARAAAGASERMPMAVAETAEFAADFFREQGLLVACTSKAGAVSIYEADLLQPIFLLLGGEKRGITRSFLSHADLKLFIPYERPFAQSLGTTSSTAVIAFERMRQLVGNKKTPPAIELMDDGV